MKNTSIKYTKQVEREDLRLFFNACLSATSQSERDSEAFSQRIGLDFLHVYICTNYRTLYALMGTLPINDHNRQRIIAQLLSTPQTTPNPDENKHLFTALKHLPVHRVYKLFAQLAKERVNNRRTRKIMNSYLKWRDNFDFDLIKYRSLLRQILSHIHYPLSEEIYDFLYTSGWKKRVYEHPMLETFRQAHFSEKAIYKLPYTIAEGLATRKGIPRERFLENIAPHLSANEAWRLQNTIKTKAPLKAERQPLMKLVLYGLSNPTEEAQSHLNTYFAKKHLPKTLQDLKIVTVLDNSFSSVGSRERKMRPLATALGVDLYLKQIQKKSYSAFWTCPYAANDSAPLKTYAKGATSLAAPLIDALKLNPDWIIIVSDGCENSPTLGVDWVLKQVKKFNLIKVPFLVHINPVWSPFEYQPRPLTDQIITLGLREIETLPTVISFAEFFQEGMSQESLVKHLTGAQI